MKQLWRYWKAYRRESILAPLFKMLEASFELAVPLVMAAIIDTGIARADRPYIYRMCGVLFLLALIGLVCSVTAQYFAAKAAVGCTKAMKQDLFAHLQSLSYRELDTLGTSTMITRMTSDCNQVQAGINLTLRLLLRSPFVVLGAMVMAFTIDTKAALIFAVAIPVLAVIVFGIMVYTIPLYRKAQGKLDGVLQATRENLTGVRVIRAFGQEEQEVRSYEEKTKELENVQEFVGKLSALMNPACLVVVNLAIVALIWTGAIRVNLGILTQGAVVALYNYMSQILVELIKLANLIINVTKAVASWKRIDSVFAIQTSLISGKEQPQARGGEIRFQQAALQYTSASAEAISQITLTIQPGQSVGIIGSTGSGKTSLISLIPRFYDATRGAVLVDGLDVKDWDLEQLRSRIGIVPQKAVLFRGTIRQNLLWGKPDATEEELWQALEIAQAREVVEGKEGQLDFVLEQGGGNLSGGQRQRLTIARALVRRPEILILDDSMSALDLLTDSRLRKALSAMTPRPTVILVSQRATSVRHCDQIVVMEDGHMAGVGTHEELRKTCPVYREICDSQYREEA